MTDDRSEAEASRIERVYARRANEVDARKYSHFDDGNLFLIQERERAALKLLKRNHLDALDQLKVLEVGCGTGAWLRSFVQWGAQPKNLAGIDLLADRIDRATTLCPSGVVLQRGDGSKIPFENESFDLVVQSTVFTSILDPLVRKGVASEMMRVLRPGGFALWYDFRVDNPRNPDVRGVRRKEILQLFPNSRVNLQVITLAPPLARILTPISWLASYVLARIPFACTHYIGLIRKEP